MSTPKLNPARLPIEAAAVLLSRVGPNAVTAEMISKDLRDGAPSNADGTINVVHYGAWLMLDRRGPTARRTSN